MRDELNYSEMESAAELIRDAPVAGPPGSSQLVTWFQDKLEKSGMRIVPLDQNYLANPDYIARLQMLWSSLQQSSEHLAELRQDGHITDYDVSVINLLKERIEVQLKAMLKERKNDDGSSK